MNMPLVILERLRELEHSFALVARVNQLERSDLSDSLRVSEMQSRVHLQRASAVSCEIATREIALERLLAVVPGDVILQKGPRRVSFAAYIANKLLLDGRSILEYAQGFELEEISGLLLLDQAPGFQLNRG